MARIGWTVHDKLAMYRGLVKIFHREEKNQVKDSRNEKHKNYEVIKKLKTELQKYRDELKRADAGGQLTMNQILQNYPTHQRLLQNLDLKEMREIMERKVHMEIVILDKLMENLTKAGDELQKCGLLYDEITTHSEKNEDDEDFRRDLHNRIQEFRGKSLAGRNIQSVYRRVINLLKTEQSDFNAILDQLKKDKKMQECCLIRATQLGQLATEDAANMEKNYELRERDTHLNTAQQMTVLKGLRAIINEVEKESQALIRSESYKNLNIESVSSAAEDTETQLRKQLEDASLQLKRVQDVILVPGFNDIFPRMSEQLRHNERLIEELNKSHDLFESMMDRRMQLYPMLFAVKSEGYTDTAFLSNISVIQREIKEITMEILKVKKAVNEAAKFLMYIRSAFRRLWNMVCSVPGLVDVHISKDIDRDASMSAQALQLMEKLITVTSDILAKLRGELRPDDHEKMVAALIKRKNRMTILFASSKDQPGTKFALDLAMESADPNVPNRLEVKAASARIIEQATSKLYERQLRIIVGFLTGHCNLRGHLAKMGLSETTLRRFCNAGEENPVHLLLECDAIARRRAAQLGHLQLNVEDLPALNPRRIFALLKEIGLEEVL